MENKRQNTINDNLPTTKKAAQNKKQTEDSIEKTDSLQTSDRKEISEEENENLSKVDTQKNPYAALEIYLPTKKIQQKRGYLFVKRTFDIVSSLLALIILSPLILICLFVKWAEDFHNPIYVSKRVGKNGKLFTFYKIRTMCVGAENMKDDLKEKGLNEANGPVFKIKDDPRITKVGKFYRKFSLDELLQLFNVLNGTMSVVGPRPPLIGEVEKYTEEQKHRLDVKGGLLCLWQITKNRNSLSFDEWVRLDFEYIEKRSVWLDLKIIFKGAWMVIFDHSGQ